MLTRFLTICLTLILAGCSCSPWHGPAVITAPSGAHLCAKHYIALLTAPGYRLHTDPQEHVDSTPEAMRAQDCYPNAIPWYESLSGPGDSCTITYCPVCERAAERVRH